MLGLACVASFSQAIFKAVPLILLCGEPGSGKSTAGIVMSRLGCNGTVVGQVSAAAAARILHETRGLTVLDDLEGIASTGGKDRAGFSELVQFLKVSYNQDTATKVWSDATRGYKTERLNGFGIKVINNTKGVDPILGSRMLRVPTQKMPASIADDRKSLPPAAMAQTQALRDELHVWTYENVDAIARVYKEIYPSASERSEEIAAPLRVLARLAGDLTLIGRLEVALARTKPASFDARDPAAAVEEAARNLAAQGYREISPSHLVLEMKRMMGISFGQGDDAETHRNCKPELVGRMLRSRDIIDAAAPGRRERLYGKMLRLYPLRESFLKNVLGDQRPPTKNPRDFCKECSGCAYAAHGCPFMEGRNR